MAGFWDDYNKQQQKIMEERDKANRGKTFKPVQIGNRTPGNKGKAPVKKKTATKK